MISGVIAPVHLVPLLTLAILWALSVQRFVLAGVLYLLCGFFVFQYELIKPRVIQSLAVLSPQKTLIFLVLLWPVKLAFATREWMQARRSPTRYRAMISRPASPYCDAESFGSWADAVTWARQQAEERGIPASIIDHATLVKSDFGEPNRLSFAMYEVDAAGRTELIGKNPFR